jgi:hypothetical protein
VEHPREEKDSDGDIGSWQLVGKNRSKFRRLTSKTVKSDVFIRILDSWKKVPQCMKEDLWSSLMVCVN